MADLTFYSGFVIPFIVGTSVLFAVILYKYVRWFFRLPDYDRRRVGRNIFSVETVKGLWEAFTECLLHRRVWKVNPLLGYMHTSFALGWFLLIAVGWIETIAYLGFQYVPLQGHIFFKYFTTSLDHGPVWGVDFGMVMDLLLLYVLSGLALAMYKRIRSRALGLKKATKLLAGDKVALTSLWFIFPMRLLAESFTSGIHHSGGFLTGSLGAALASLIPAAAMPHLELAAWWMYSISLGVFFVAMPFSRYMHIFTEVPLIFMRNYKVKARPEGSSYDNFQLQACSRCGICIDPCPIASELSVLDIQATYHLRDRRDKALTPHVIDTCLMCGRCTAACPVGIEQDVLRLSSRVGFARKTTLYGAPRYDYLPVSAVVVTAQTDESITSTVESTSRVGFFAGCMTKLTPSVTASMERIFAAAGVDVWWADRDGGVCCGRPMRLSGNLPAARKMSEYNTAMFRDAGISTLVTGCPICYKSFTAEYALEELGIRVLHHSQYIAELIASGRLKTSVGQSVYAYHDPCELRGIHSEPRYILSHVATLVPTAEDVHCCGGSMANFSLDTSSQTRIGGRAVRRLEEALAAAPAPKNGGEKLIATACPQCKKSMMLAASQGMRVVDISEVVAAAI